MRCSASYETIFHAQEFQMELFKELLCIRALLWMATEYLAAAGCIPHPSHYFAFAIPTGLIVSFQRLVLCLTSVPNRAVNLWGMQEAQRCGIDFPAFSFETTAHSWSRTLRRLNLSKAQKRQPRWDWKIFKRTYHRHFKVNFHLVYKNWDTLNMEVELMMEVKGKHENSSYENRREICKPKRNAISVSYCPFKHPFIPSAP